MNSLRIAENIVQMRKQKGVTQDEVASFLGVTKASVSKWENGQNMPDIMLLPQLATYFEVTVDELLGYEPQLSKEQIQKIYGELAANFAKMPFEEAFAKSELLVKRYYSCYPFLFQMCVLWLNHFMLAEEKERQMKVLEEILNLCDHILADSNNTGLCNDALMMKAMVNLQCGRPREVIDGIEELLSPYRIMRQSDTLLVQAYMMAGETEQADAFAQMSMYQHMLFLIGDGTQHLMLHMQEPEICEETVRRMDAVIEAFHMESLNPNLVAAYQYQVALCCCVQGKKEKALQRLLCYARGVSTLLEHEWSLHGDEYFTKLDRWFEGLDLGSQRVSDKKIVLQSARENLNNPVFAEIRETKEFARVIAELAE